MNEDGDDSRPADGDGRVNEDGDDSRPKDGDGQLVADGDASAIEPSDAVLEEALSSGPPADRDGGELEPASDEELERSVEQALDHAGD